MTEQEKKSYLANWAVRHDGKKFGIDNRIELANDEASPLLADGAIREIAPDDDTKPEADSTSTEKGKGK